MYGGSPDARRRPARDRVPARRDREGGRAGLGGQVAQRDGTRIRRRLGARRLGVRDGDGAGARARAADRRPADGVPGTPTRRRVHRGRGGVSRAGARARRPRGGPRGGRRRPDLPLARPRLARAPRARAERQAVDAARLPLDARRARDAIPPRPRQDGRPNHGRPRQPPGRGDHDGARRGGASRARPRGRRRSQHQQAPPGPVGDLQLRPASRAGRALAPVRQSRRRGGEAARGPAAPARGLHRRADRGTGPDRGGRRLARTARVHDAPTASCCAPRRTPSSASSCESPPTPASAWASSSRCAGTTSAGPSACSSSSEHSPATSRARPRAAASATSRSATRHSEHSTASHAERTSPAPTTTSSPAWRATGSIRRRSADATSPRGTRPACRRCGSTTSATPPERC